MKRDIDNIGFYTLTENRIKQASCKSPIWRGELLITQKCNFKCPYCRHVGGELSLQQAKHIIKIWAKQGLKNIRFSGGEPTLHKELSQMCSYAKELGVNRIAISTNGHSDYSLYERLMYVGVNDFSISLDACCASMGDVLSGVSGSWEKVVGNIRLISRFSYTTIGVVLGRENVDALPDLIRFIDTLGVSDIRIIPSAQNGNNFNKMTVPSKYLQKYPVLKYRVTNFNGGESVRGLSANDCNRCRLVLDDMAVMDEYHYPCIVYMREGGRAIGSIKNKNYRQARKKWSDGHDVKKDKICKTNCLDVCRDYNRKKEYYLRRANEARQGLYSV